MGNRLGLHNILVSILGNTNVYFQPPSNIKMLYPCIVYKLGDIGTDYADNLPYKHEKKYEITVIDLDPDSDIPDNILQLPRSAFVRSFISDQLNHTVLRLIY